MNPLPAHPGTASAIETLLAFHRRLERSLAQLAALPGLLESRGAGSEASAAAAAMLHCFGPASARHHADEEQVLLPLLERRIGVGEREPFRALCAGLAADHRAIAQAWRGLRRPLEAVAEGLARRLDAERIREFRVLHAAHIGIEEAALHDLALRRLARGDLAVLRQRLEARRARLAA